MPTAVHALNDAYSRLADVTAELWVLEAQIDHLEYEVELELREATEPPAVEPDEFDEFDIFPTFEPSKRTATWNHECCVSGSCWNRKHDNAPARKSKATK